MIKFKTLTMQNFFSVGNLPLVYQLDKNPVTMVTGSNGNGKTATVTDSLTYVLYGVAYRNINKKQMINSINGRGCLVTIEFETRGKNYKVSRGIKPDVFEIYEDGVLLNQEAASRDYQQILESNILGMNLKSFKQIVILSVSDYIPFMELRSKERRAIIEELLDIQVFSVMNDVLSEKRSEIKELKSRVQTKLNGLEIELRSHASKIESLKAKDLSLIESNELKIAEANETIAKRLDEIQSLTSQMNELSSSIPDIDELRTRKSKIQTVLGKVTTAKDRLTKDIDFFSTHEDCPVCSQQITEELRNNMIHTKTTKMSEVESVHQSATGQMDELLDVLRKVADTNTKVRDLSSEITQLTSSVSSNQKYIQQLERHSKEILNKSADEEDRERAAYETMAKQQVNMSDKMSKLMVREDDYQVCAKLLKDDGIKTQIIDKYIPTINKILNHYLENFEFAVSFNFDNNFNEVIRSRYRDEFSYASFSKGERARIDFAITLAFREIAKIKNSVSANILVIDELFENMDSYGVSKAIEMLSSLTNTHTFVVSHKQEVIDNSQHRINLVKDQGFTMISSL